MEGGAFVVAIYYISKDSKLNGQLKPFAKHGSAVRDVRNVA